MIHRVLRLAAALVVASVAAAPVSAAGLFSSAALEKDGATDGALGVRRFRDTTIDTAYLARTIAPLGHDDEAGRAAAVQGSSLVRVPLFGDVSVTLRRDGIAEAFDGGYVWTGTPVRDPGGMASLVVKSGRVTGAVFVNGRTYRIDPIGEGATHRVRELDTGAFPPEFELEHDVHTPPSAPSAPAAPEAGQRANTTINVLVGYTGSAKSRVTNIKQQANLAVSIANESYKRSKVSITLKLVGIQEVKNYDDTAVASYDTILTDLTDGTIPAFKPFHTARARLKADLVSVLNGRTEYCGVAWMPANPSKATAGEGFSTVTVDCIMNYSFQHELGHNMGLNHDRYVSSSAPNTVYNFGYVDLAKKFRTTMAYNNQCADKGFSCQRVPYFSNPLVRYQNRPTGIAVGKTGAAYAARRLNETRTAIASYQ